MPDATTTFGLIAIVLMVAALGAGFVERAPLSSPIVFLGMGLLLSGRGLGVIDLDVHDPTLEVVATLSLELVLFLDAVNLRFDELGQDWRVPMLALGPGTLLTIGLVSLAAWLVLGTTVVESLLLGAILASTDPVVLREILRDGRIPRSVRRSLKVEAGMNDVVVLPLVLVLIAVAREEAGGALEWLEFGARLLIVGPVAGIAVGAGGAWLLAKVDRIYGIRREYQALFGVGLVLASFFAGDRLGGDGFLAAFAAGIAVTAFNFELCDCFLEFGEVISEMAMMFAFVLFGAVLADTLGLVALAPGLLFAVWVIGVARPASFLFVLRRAKLSNTARGFMAWFGPRGLASLVLALLVVEAGVAGGEEFLAIVGVVVLVSITAHGVTATPLTAFYARKVAAETLAEEREGTATGLFEHEDGEVPRIGVDELQKRLHADEPALRPIVLDVRTRSQFERDHSHIPGSIRVLPDHVADWAQEHDRERQVVAYCT